MEKGRRRSSEGVEEEKINGRQRGGGVAVGLGGGGASRKTGAVKSMKVIKMEKGDKSGGDGERLQGG